MNKLEQHLKSAGIINYHQEYLWLKNEAPSSNKLEEWVQQRAAGMPLAYILQSMDFLSLSLYVDPNVLIPRPETEEMVEHAIAHIRKEDQVIVDLGTGSGCIALSLKQAFPDKTVIGIDKYAEALNVAKINQKRYPEYPVQWIQGDWLDSIALSDVDVIISNPPYVESSWEHKSIQHEPATAIFSKEDGLHDIQKIIKACQKHQLSIWIEHGYKQTLYTLFNSDWHVEQVLDDQQHPRFIMAKRRF